MSGEELDAVDFAALLLEEVEDVKTEEDKATTETAAVLSWGQPATPFGYVSESFSDESGSDKDPEDLDDAKRPERGHHRRVSSAMTGGGVPLSHITPDCVVHSIFAMFDTEGTGFIEAGDFQEILSAFGIEELSAQLALTKLAEQSDVGTISLAEFKKWVKEDEAFLIMKNPEKLKLITIVSHLFDEYDTAHTASVSWIQWLDHLQKNGITEEDAKDTWDRCNPEAKDRVTFGMFWKMMCE